MLVDADRMPGARWFPGRAPQLRARTCSSAAPADDAGDALVFRGEDKARAARCRTRRCIASASQVAHGVEGARRRARAIASPRTCRTCPRRSIAMLGAAAMGAIWSSCSPDFGVQGVLDRFGQIEPARALHRRRLLVQRQADRRSSTRSRRSSRELPTVERVVVVPYLRQARRRGRRICRRFAARSHVGRVPRAVRRPGRSTTRGCRSIIRSTSCIRRARPACRSASSTAPAGTLLQHLKEHLLHGDLKRGRPAVLLHDLRLDDVELARVRARRRRDAAALRRLAVRRPRPACCGTSPTPSG